MRGTVFQFVTRSVSFEVARRDELSFWPKANLTVAWGNAPGNQADPEIFLAEGHIHNAI